MADHGSVFDFAFGGVGGIEPGTDPDHPRLPFVPVPAALPLMFSGIGVLAWRRRQVRTVAA